MTPERMRIKLAEWEAIPECESWTPLRNGLAGPEYIQKWSCVHAKCRPQGVCPNYPEDLNAVASLTSKLNQGQHGQYRQILERIVRGTIHHKREPDGISLMSHEQYRAWFDATALQRCEALLKVLNLWEEE